MSGSLVEFPVNGTSAGGYLAAPDGGTGPGVLVLQEYAAPEADVDHSVAASMAAQSQTATGEEA